MYTSSDPVRSSGAATTTGEALDRLAAELPSVHLPGSTEYDAAVTPWNVAVAPHPLAVVVASRADDVVAAVRFAGRHHLRVAVQATGHGASSTMRDAILVSTAELDGLELHAEQGWVRAEAGVTWDQVLEAGAAYGLAGLCGSAPGVGVVGYTTGGGIGPLVRTHGLASDRVRAFEVVTGDGELRRATTTEHPDLYWGLRGGKGALGIITAVEFDLLPISEIYGGAVYFDGADAPTVLRAWARWSTTLPREATTSVALLRLPPLPGVPPPLAGRLVLAVRFAWTGDAEHGAQVLGPIREAAAPIIDTVAVMPYAALGSIHADPVDPMPVHEEHALLGDLPEEAVDRLLEQAGPDADCPQVIVEVRQLGGAVSAGGWAPSAYAHRDAAYSLLTIGIGVPPVVEAVTASGRAILEAVAQWDTGGRLPNFAPRTDEAWLERAYDAGTLARLRRVSAAYDPAGVLHGAQVLRGEA
jgi:FAD/FMN-containing dehydrogenase